MKSSEFLNISSYTQDYFHVEIVKVLAASFTLPRKLGYTTTNKYLVRVLVVVLHVCISVVGPIPSPHFLGGHPYIGSTTILPDMVK